MHPQPPSLATSLATFSTNDHELFDYLQTIWGEISGGILYDTYGIMHSRQFFKMHKTS